MGGRKVRIIISPAKKMLVDNDSIIFGQMPEFIEDAKSILKYLKELEYEELKSIWKCSDKIATLNYDRIKNMDLSSNLTPAILSYEGIQYQYMAPSVAEESELEYYEEHLRILSGFYGVLKPFDGVVPYRLEMQSKLKGDDIDSLYDYWDNRIAEKIQSESKCILNLASKEYSKCVSKYLDKDTKFISCVFGEIKDNKVIEKGTYAKMARGEMVRFMAKNKVSDIEEIKNFDGLGYIFREDLSSEDKFVFIKS